MASEPTLDVDQARQRILGAARPVGVEAVELADALGRVPATRTYVAQTDVPPFANSSMDGFAVRTADLPGPLPISGEAAAGGGPAAVLAPGSAVRIMTGAPLPAGADAVVPVEETEESHGAVTIRGAVTLGANIRAAGHDTRAGETVCLPGVLGPAAIAVLASMGLATFEVRRRPRVVILVTGDELVPPGQPLQPGQIHDANSFGLAAAVQETGAQPIRLPRAADDEAALQALVVRGAGDGDLLVVSGGVSVGRRDYLRPVLERIGRLSFWRIAVQPGKPLAFGDVGGTPVIGLPGNPVSALVTFELFVRPLIRAMLGRSGDGRDHQQAMLTEPMDKDPDRQAYLRVVLSRQDGNWRARPAGGQASSQLRSLAAANGLLAIPRGLARAAAGERFDAIVLDPTSVEVGS